MVCQNLIDKHETHAKELSNLVGRRGNRCFIISLLTVGVPCDQEELFAKTGRGLWPLPVFVEMSLLPANR